MVLPLTRWRRPRAALLHCTPSSLATGVFYTRQELGSLPGRCNSNTTKNPEVRKIADKNKHRVLTCSLLFDRQSLLQTQDSSDPGWRKEPFPLRGRGQPSSLFKKSECELHNKWVSSLPLTFLPALLLPAFLSIWVWTQGLLDAKHQLYSDLCSDFIWAVLCLSWCVLTKWTIEGRRVNKSW